MKKAVFFDRDATLIVDKVYLNDPNDIEYLPGAVPALTLLTEHNFDLFIVTNQSGIARGLVEPNSLELIHQNILAYFGSHKISFKEIISAPYMSNSKHYYRKPNPGMLEELIHAHAYDPTHCWMVGDKMIDVEAGHRARTKSILLGSKAQLKHSQFTAPEYITDSLIDVAEFIIGHQ
ncbi:MAG: HAD-IIIA family hydrolase [Bdellovibrionaceae bacterium]|jgi:D-glycero-D-manno-heptose 1,7-bisphosphate phosphatase|nr:HAD-IIIA family hydrolase [Pseudobdellovibrionaceae bacterium]